MADLDKEDGARMASLAKGKPKSRISDVLDRVWTQIKH